MEQLDRDVLERVAKAKGEIEDLNKELLEKYSNFSLEVHRDEGSAIQKAKEDFVTLQSSCVALLQSVIHLEVGISTRRQILENQEKSKENGEVTDGDKLTTSNDSLMEKLKELESLFKD